jgi:uncharacterized protein
MYYARAIQIAWEQATKQFPVLLLTGPRQVGKTTFLRHICSESRHYVTLDDLRLRTLAKNDPPLFLQRYPSPVLIDEIQYAPELLSYIKIAVDEDRTPGKFWLTGSQQFSMMRGISETLAGRIAIFNMLGFSNRERLRQPPRAVGFLPAADMNADIDPPSMNLKETYKAIWRGGLPELVASEHRPDPQLFFSSYVQTYLERDVRDLTQVGDGLAFAQFIRACAARTGQLLNLADLGRDVDISIPTAKKWLSILQTSFLVHLLPPYHSNLTKRLVKTPKLYFLDTGLCSYLTEWTDPATLEAGSMSGAVFETHVLGELMKGYLALGVNPNLYFYRDRDGNEIDFVLSQNGQLYPIEAKKTATPKQAHVKSFQRLEALGKPVGHGGVVCLVQETIPLNRSTTAIPVSML